MKRLSFYLLAILSTTLMLLSLTTIKDEIGDNRIFRSPLADSIWVNPWGMNAHLTFPNSYEHVEELCKSMSDVGVDIVRLDIYWWYGNMFMQQELCDKAVYYADKYGLKILLNFPQIPNKIEQSVIDEWLNMIRGYALRYNGSNAIWIEGEKTPRYPKVTYFEVMNELELKYKEQNIDIKGAFKLIKESSEMLHNLAQNEKLQVVLPGISRIDDFVRELFEYKEGGHSVVDYVDVLNTHIYTTKTDDLIYLINKWKELRELHHCEDKPFWITELGNTLWDVSEKTQADNLFKQYILSMAYGVERVFYYQYHSFGGNYFKNKHQKEEFFGIIENSTSKSVVSFWENDGIFKSLSEGDGLGKIFITDSLKATIYTITDKMCKKLKDNGVAIGGKGYTINKITIKRSAGNEHVLWEGKWTATNHNKPLQIPSEMFGDITPKDSLVAYISNVKGYKEWQGVKPMLAYYAYQYLASILNEGSTRPLIEKASNGTYITYWKYKGTNYYAIWNDKNDNVTVTLNDKSNVFISRYNGNRMQLKNTCIRVGNSPVVLESKGRMLKFN